MAPPRKARYAWMLVAQKNCRDCIRRSGMGARLFSAWSRIGLPGSGFSICGEYCGCVLVLAEEGSATDGVKGIAIEDYLPENYDELSPREQVEAYKAAAQAMRDDVDALRGIIKDIEQPTTGPPGPAQWFGPGRNRGKGRTGGD